jgi:cysteine synthase B
MSLVDAIHDTPLSASIGRTPLVRLRRFEPRVGVEIYAKLESRNPGGSVKDRAALSIIVEGERTGALGGGRILLDATSGNTGIAYAMLGGARGHRVQLCVPANVTPERKRILQAYGADLVFTDAMDGSDGAILEARRLCASAPDKYFYADQYSNSANWRAHYVTTAPEILEQTAGRLTHFVAGLGTSGTFVGTARRLREANPGVKLVSMEPSSPLHGLEGLKHMATAIVPPIYDASIADRHLFVATDLAHDLTRRLAREEGLLVGPSSGAALAACLDVAADLRSGMIVTIFPDGGDRYLSERFWSEGGSPAGTPMRAAIELTSAAREVIRADAEKAYPHECCGALFGPPAAHAGGRVATDVIDAMPLTNVTTGERRRRFLVSPAEYQLAEKRAEATGTSLVGFYHSHPDHPAEPSQFDLEHAWPNLSYVIASVLDGRVDVVRSWRLRADRSRFEEEALSWPSEF